MLRRLPERHKNHALHLLTGTPSSSSSFLYGKPHDMVRYIISVASKLLHHVFTYCSFEIKGKNAVLAY